MVEAFAFKVLLSFLVAGTWITLATIISERFGTKVGGLLGNLPSNILVSLLFIGWTQNELFAAEAAKVGPIAMLCDSVFLFIYILFARKYRERALLLGLAGWLLFALPVGLSGFSNLWLGVMLYAALTLIAFFYLEKNMRIPQAGKRRKSYSLVELLLRALLAGGIVSSTVLLAAFAGPVWGGLFAAFPAVMLSTMYLLSKAQGTWFAQATGKVMLPASANIVVYCAAVSMTYPLYGLVAGTVISYLAALAFVLLLYPLTKKMS